MSPTLDLPLRRCHAFFRITPQHCCAPPNTVRENRNIYAALIATACLSLLISSNAEQLLTCRPSVAADAERNEYKSALVYGIVNERRDAPVSHHLIHAMAQMLILRDPLPLLLLAFMISDGLTCRSAPENVAMSDEGVWESALSQQGHRRRRSNPQGNSQAQDRTPRTIWREVPFGTHRRGPLPSDSGASSQVHGQIWGGAMAKSHFTVHLCWSI